jgi:hypothetical protein
LIPRLIRSTQAWLARMAAGFDDHSHHGQTTCNSGHSTKATARRTRRRGLPVGARTSRCRSGSSKAEGRQQLLMDQASAGWWHPHRPWCTNLGTLSRGAAASTAGAPTCTLRNVAGCCMHLGWVLDVRVVYHRQSVAFASCVSARLLAATMWQAPECPALDADAVTRCPLRPRRAHPGMRPGHASWVLALGRQT